MYSTTPDLPEFPFAVAPIVEIDGADDVALCEHIANYTPVVLRGYAREQVLGERLSGLDSSASIRAVEPLLGNAKIPFTLLPPEQKGDIGIGEDLQANFRVDDRVASAAQFLSVVEELVGDSSGACAYAASMPLERFPKIQDLIACADTLAERKLWTRLLWVGSGRHVVDLHHDEMLNLITMYSGVKRITLLPPTSLPSLYPAPLHRKVGGVPRSLVKLLSLDHERYPRMEEALRASCQTVLYPGDALFIPPLWWHYVESYGFNLMVNAWYNDLVNKPDLARANQTLRDAIAGHSDRRPDPNQLQKYRNLLLSEGRDDKLTRSDDQRADTSSDLHTDALSKSLVHARAALTPLPKYWRDWMVLQFEYYVLRIHGDPYPTLPNALAEVAEHFRSQSKKGRLARLLAAPRRLLRSVRREVRNRVRVWKQG